MAIKIRTLIKHHRQLWHWLSENPKAEKYDWPEWETNDGTVKDYFSYCAACEFKAQSSKENRCKGDCLFIWPYDVCSAGGVGLFNPWEYYTLDTQHGIFDTWLYSDNIQRRKALAKQIRDLPVNPIYIDKYKLTLKDIDPKEVLNGNQRNNKEWLKEKNVCLDVYKWFINQDERNGIKVVEKLMVNGRFDWSNWLIVRRMDYRQYVSYAIFAADQVIDIYENKYPYDTRPRKGLEEAKKCIKSNSDKIKYTYAAYADDAANAAADAAAYATAAAATAAAYATAADAAADAAVAADAATAAAYATAAAANDDADDAAYAAAYAAYATDDAAKKELQTKIINYGIKLLIKG